jgi:hypothetical protein
MRILFLIFLIIAAGINIFSERLAVLKELEKPYIMKIDNGQLLISDETVKVHLYNLKDLKYKQIGKRGNGPGEYPIIPEVYFADKHIFIYRRGKCMFFNREGNYISEFKIPPAKTSFIRPFGKHYLQEKFGLNKNSISWYSELSLVSHTREDGLKHKNQLYYQDQKTQKEKSGKEPINIMKTYFSFIVYRDKVFVHDNTIGFYVEIYDLEGNQIGKINIPYERKKVPENYTDRPIEIIKRKGKWELFKNNFYFDLPEYFPAFRRFAVDNDKLYFLTYNEKPGKRELVVADLKGNILKKAYVPYFNEEMHTYFAIKNDRFYYIMENEDTEEWELHVEDIK